MDVDYFDEIWAEQDKTYGSYKDAGSSAWDRRAEDFNRHVSDERIGRISGLLLGKKMLHENSTVLDIGCGPGKFVLAFAQKAKKVVGVDISAKMLHYARENTDAQRIVNAEFMEMNWEKADLTALQWTKKFSLVTAIMAPVLSSRESLEKMIAASSEYCFLCHFVERRDSINDELKKLIFGRLPVDKYGNKAIYCSLNILWHYKLFPEITYYNTDSESTRLLEEANRHFLARLEAKFPLTAAQKAEVLKFLKNKADNGYIKERITGKIAFLYWKNAN